MLYILRDKVPVPVDDMQEWGEWFATHDRTVKQDQVGAYFVSTVFIGIDHNFLLHSPGPLVFETMVFGPGDEGWQMRAPTWELALECHEHGIAWARGQQ